MLNKFKKKRYFLGVSFFLIIFLIISTFSLKIRNEKKYKKNLEEIKNFREQEISKVEEKLRNSLNLPNKKDLLDLLKEKSFLNSGSKNWKDVFKDSSSISQIKEESENVTRIIEEEKIKKKWETILLEIENFFKNYDPKNFQDVKNWVRIKNYPDPLNGTDLSGIKTDLLKKLNDLGRIPGSDDAKASESSEFYKYKNHVRLDSVGDGNCFLNSFSVLLTGRERDVSLSLPLRVKACLELMSDPEKFFFLDDISALKASLFGTGGNNSRGGFAKNHAWLENSDIFHLALILKRNIIVISRAPSAYSFTDDFLIEDSSLLLPEFSPIYHDPFILYNSGGHFEPLIEKKIK